MLARVEHVFAAITRIGGKSTHTIELERAEVGMTIMALCYNIKCLTHLKKAGINAF